MERKLIVVFTITFLIGFVVPVSPDMISEKKLFLIGSYTYETYDLIIITPWFFVEDLQPLADHKESHDITTKIVSLDDIYDGLYFNVQGRDDSEKIKYFIMNAIENWDVKYVLLVGNKAIPRRICNTIVTDALLDFTCDLYYADIYDGNGYFSDWDSDGDGIYGEWYFGQNAEDKDIDLTPDVAVGRLACDSDIEVKIAVDKIIHYEEKAADPSWFKQMVVAGGDTFPDSYCEGCGYEGEINTQKAIDVMNGFVPVKLWASTGELDRFGLNILKSINKGCGFLYLSGHGNWHGWITSDSNGVSLGFFSIFHVFFLKNKDMLPICILSGCHVSKIEKPCLGWQLIRKSNGGAIATIGPTSLGYLGYEFPGGGLDWLELKFFEEYANGSNILGEIWKDALQKYVYTFPVDWDIPSSETSCAVDVKTVQEWILLGDPSLKIGGYD